MEQQLVYLAKSIEEMTRALDRNSKAIEHNSELWQQALLQDTINDNVADHLEHMRADLESTILEVKAVKASIGQIDRNLVIKEDDTLC